MSFEGHVAENQSRRSRWQRYAFFISLCLNAIFIITASIVILMGPPSSAPDTSASMPTATTPINEPHDHLPTQPVLGTNEKNRNDSVEEKLAAAPLVQETELTYLIDEKTAQHLPFATTGLGHVHGFNNLPALHWNSTSDAQTYLIEWSPTEDFTTSEVAGSVTATSFQLPFSKVGRSYWRVRAKNESTDSLATSFASRPVLLNTLLPSPHLASTPDGAAYYANSNEFKTGGHAFRLEWPSVSYADRYEIEWSADGEPLHKKNFFSRHNIFQVNVHETRHFSARVRVINQSGEVVSGFSEPRTMKFEKNLARSKVSASASPIDVAVHPEPEAMRAPAAVHAALHSAIELKRPGPNAPVIFLENVPLKIDFEWRPIESAQEYQVQWSKDAEFSSVISERKLSKTKLVYSKDFQEGKIFWRVRARIASHWGDWSEASSFEVIYE